MNGMIKLMILLKSDIPKFKDSFIKHFTSLTLYDRYNRFFHSISDYALNEWLDQVYKSKAMTLFFIEQNEVGDFIGVLQMSRYSYSSSFEISVSVTEQRKGIAYRLLHDNVIPLLEEFNQFGPFDLTFDCLLNNKACYSLFKKCGFDCKTTPDGIEGRYRSNQ